MKPVVTRQRMESVPDNAVHGWPEGFAHGRANRRAVLVLSALRGITPRALHALAWESGSAFDTLAAVRAGRAGSENDTRVANGLDPADLASRVVACGARLVPPGTAEYPGSLVDLADPPVALFVRGRSLVRSARRVAVVGARRCTAVGQEVARALGRSLVQAGACHVSGGARGIDTEGHVGALDAGGPSIAVLGCGIDQTYPPRHRRLFERIVEVGTVVSEYPPGVPAEPHHFPQRNRIIAGLCEAVVIVEGTKGSGSVITADHGLDLGRSVFAVPGSVTSPQAWAPLDLIRQGATMIRGPGDLLDDLGLRRPGATASSASAGDAEPDDDEVLASLTELERRVLARLGPPELPERIAAAAGLTLGEVVPVLLGLEMKRFARATGGRYRRAFRDEA